MTVDASEFAIKKQIFRARLEQASINFVMVGPLREGGKGIPLRKIYIKSQLGSIEGGDDKASCLTIKNYIFIVQSNSKLRINRGFYLKE